MQTVNCFIISYDLVHAYYTLKVRTDAAFLIMAPRAVPICPYYARALVYRLKYGTPSGSATEIQMWWNALIFFLWGILDGAVWNGAFLFMHSVTMPPLSCITELMCCDSLKLFYLLPPSY